MKFVYTPEGADPRSWDFDPNKLLNVEAEIIERHTGLTFAEVIENMSKGSMLALHGILFVLLKRSDPTLKWDSVQFSLSELDLDLDEDEAQAARAELEAKALTADGLSKGEQKALDEFVSQGVPAVPKD